MLERDIEKYLVKKIRAFGGLAYKFSSPSNRAVPHIPWDAQHNIFFVELKATGKKPTPLQTRIHDSLRDLGGEVYVIDSKDMVDTLCAVKKEFMKRKSC